MPINEWVEFAGFEECDNRTSGNILWNFMSCFETYAYAGRMLNYFYSIMCREAFGDEYR